MTEQTKSNDTKINETPAYLIASSFMPEGHGSLMPYAEATHPLMEKWGGELLIAGETGQFMELFEGEWKQDAYFTLFKFPSMEHLQGFWKSEEYQSVKHLRTSVIPPNFTFAVKGFDPSAWEENNLK